MKNSILFPLIALFYALSFNSYKKDDDSKVGKSTPKNVFIQEDLTTSFNEFLKNIDASDCCSSPIIKNED